MEQWVEKVWLPWTPAHEGSDHDGLVDVVEEEHVEGMEEEEHRYEDGF